MRLYSGQTVWLAVVVILGSALGLALPALSRPAAGAADGRQVWLPLVGQTLPTPTATVTFTPSSTPTHTPTATPTATHTRTPTTTATSTRTPTATFTVTATRTRTATATRTRTATATATATPALSIRALSYRGSDEYIEIFNAGPGSQLMDGWKIHSVEGDQWYTFPMTATLAAVDWVRVHSGPDAFDSPPHHLKWTSGYIWNNSGDRAELQDAMGRVLEIWVY